MKGSKAMSLLPLNISVSMFPSVSIARLEQVNICCLHEAQNT